ncbi:MAG TPA: class I SAM-dependent methyltransferase [Candidatus Hydrogenedentes bacterium]|nr:class I SAM-dependent methyltransferase [Candidatus Hydrogenedentota bacterium]
MLLNDVEKIMMNNPLRAAVQRQWEGRRLLRLGGEAPKGIVLEVGCGCGVGVEIILDRLHAERAHAFDLDPHMVTLAQKRLNRKNRPAYVWVGDVTRIPAPDATYAAVFDFGIIHHVPNWRDAITEIHRVLKPGGRFYVEEIMRRFVLNPIVRTLTVHPLEDRFDMPEFHAGLEQAGFTVTNTAKFLGWAAWFIAEKQ